MVVGGGQKGGGKWKEERMAGDTCMLKIASMIESLRQAAGKIWSP